jgi:hypothetical protein
MSVGANASAPVDDRFPLISVSTEDEMAYQASADEGATTSILVNNEIAFEVEDA